jgi:hypothetical protein
MELVFLLHFIYLWICIAFSDTVSNSGFITSEEELGKIVERSGHGLT